MHCGADVLVVLVPDGRCLTVLIAVSPQIGLNAPIKV